MTRSTAPQGAEASGARPKIIMAVVATLLLVVGLWWLVGGVAYKVRLDGQADRLRAEGLQTSAAVSDFQYGNRADRASIRVSYDHERHGYAAKIPCGDWPGCGDTVPATIKIWLDPKSPRDFVAENGFTGDSWSFLNSWKTILFGAFFTVIGGGIAYLLLREWIGDLKADKRLKSA